MRMGRRILSAILIFLLIVPSALAATELKLDEQGEAFYKRLVDFCAARGDETADTAMAMRQGEAQDSIPYYAPIEGVTMAPFFSESGPMYVLYITDRQRIDEEKERMFYQDFMRAIDTTVTEQDALSMTNLLFDNLQTAVGSFMMSGVTHGDWAYRLTRSSEPEGEIVFQVMTRAQSDATTAQIEQLSLRQRVRDAYSAVQAPFAEMDCPLADPTDTMADEMLGETGFEILPGAFYRLLVNDDGNVTNAVLRLTPPASEERFKLLTLFLKVFYDAPLMDLTGIVLQLHGAVVEKDSKEFGEIKSDGNHITLEIDGDDYTMTVAL